MYKGFEFCELHKFQFWFVSYLFHVEVSIGPGRPFWPMVRHDKMSGQVDKARHYSRLGQHSPKGVGRAGPKETAYIAHRAGPLGPFKFHFLNLFHFLLYWIKELFFYISFPFIFHYFKFIFILIKNKQIQIFFFFTIFKNKKLTFL